MVTHIFVAPARDAPMRAVTAVEALAGVGLEGDRYAEQRNRRSPDYEATFIEIENVASSRRERSGSAIS